MQRQQQATAASRGPSLVVEETTVYHEGHGGLSAGSETADDNIVVGTLRLRGGPVSDRRVAWSDDVIDNEGMGKKKSKICCIFHKQRAFDESSSDDSSSSSDSYDSSDGENSGNEHNSDKISDCKGNQNPDSQKDHPTDENAPASCSHDHHHHHHHHHRSRRTRKSASSKPNAYERQPKYTPKSNT
ncbi:phosphatase inhibitor-domain-containing protein [Limtongia smithiae]|uniref:phosphatase inhibitor-domain-containing protein n=1 Tax=Limtongia smithiae TaxID=1125753 RepID=UPI0034CF8859